MTTRLRTGVLAAALSIGLLAGGCAATGQGGSVAGVEAPPPDAGPSDEAPTPDASPSEEARPRGALPEPDGSDPAAEGDHGATLEALADGGHVVYLRHAATEAVTEGPDVDLDDPSTQRNLSEEGRRQAEDIGRAFARLDIPVGTVVTSPYWRARETAQLAFGDHTITVDEDLLYDEHPGADRSHLAATVRRMLARRPADGTNTVIVGHGGNLRGATRVMIDEGAIAVFTPVTDAEADLVGVIPAGDWAELP